MRNQTEILKHHADPATKSGQAFALSVARPNVVADPPKKPDSKYGSRPI